MGAYDVSIGRKIVGDNPCGGSPPKQDSFRKNNNLIAKLFEYKENTINFVIHNNRKYV